MSVTYRGIRTEYGVKVGDTVMPVNTHADAVRLKRTLMQGGSTIQADLVSRRVKTVEHAWEPAQ